MNPKSILIVKTSAIGDVIHTFPVLEYLRKKFPDAKIDWVVEKRIVSLLSAHPDLSEVIPIDSKSWRKTLLAPMTLRAFFRQMRKTHYDVLFDLQGNSKSALVTAFAKAKVKVGYGWKCVREKTNLLVTDVRKDVALDGNVRQKYLALVQSYFNDESEVLTQGATLQLSPEEQQRLSQICAQDLIQTRPCLMITFGSRWPNKQFHLSVLLPFLKAIEKRYPFSFMVIYGNEQEKQTAQHLVETLQERAFAVGDLSLPLWQALMWRVHGVIAVDSAALHLCGTTATPSFSVFGPSLARVYKPLEDRHLALQVCPYAVAFSKHCPNLRTCATGACMKEIKVEDLLRAFEMWVEQFLEQGA